ncbi:RNA polymerase sigma factor [Aquisphaera insulae]|uniref:RNA polymerase sigma factor n=1 Tax=Aquisphaera insulae TaxID=2712864 RepID=UPI0013EB81E4|nr:RNA polymerase sigma factor [Aquisphaera insulae]
MPSDRDVFLGLVDDHGAVVLAFLRRLCGRVHDAEDLFQEVAVRVWRNLGSRPRLRNPRAWLMTIAYRTFLDHRSTRNLPATPGDDGEILTTRAGPDHDPAVLVEMRERCEIVRDAVAGLSPPIREVLALHYTGGLSLREVAGVLGISVGTVKSRLGAGLEQLRRELS